MKTPIREFIDEVNYKIDYLTQKQLEDERYQTVNYDVTIKVLGEIESILRGSYLQKEKNTIIEAFCQGNKDEWHLEDKYQWYLETEEPAAENYYNETFEK